MQQSYDERLFDVDERLRVDIAFNGFTGWEWGLHQRAGYQWVVLDSGLESTIQGATHAATQALGQVFG